MSIEPLALDFVLEVHEVLLERYGGAAGIRDLEALESALAQPYAELFGMMRYEGAFMQAAAYFYFLSRAHAFTDGNKRTAMACALTWLRLHSITLPHSDPELEEIAVAAVADHWPVEKIAQALRS